MCLKMNFIQPKSLCFVAGSIIVLIIGPGTRYFVDLLFPVNVFISKSANNTLAFAWLNCSFRFLF